MVIAHASHQPTANGTIVLVHGGFSSGEEWDQVWPLLIDQGYHVLIPDLPGHGKSLGVSPFEVNDAARRLAELIETQAKKRVAHVVAISIGAHIAAALTSQYPDRVESLAVSGFNLFTPGLFSPLLSPLVYMFHRSSGFWQKPTVEWERFCKGQGSFSMTRDVLNILFSSRELQSIKARTLVVAAIREGIGADNVDHSRRLFATVVPDNGSRVVQHRKMRHPWNADEPGLLRRW